MRVWKRIALGVGVLAGLAVILVGAVVVYAYATFETRMSAPDTAYPELAATTDPEAIERGRYLVYGPAHCVSCHGTYADPHKRAGVDISTVPVSGGYAFEMGPMGTLYAANLTPDVETGIGARSDKELARTIRTGVLSTGAISLFMRYSAANLADEDLVAVLSYLRSIPPVAHAVPATDAGMFPLLSLLFHMTADLSATPTYVPAGPEPTVERGAYLADNVMLCTSCHTTYDMSTYEPNGPKGGGGSVDVSHGTDTDMEFVPPNLTSDPTGMTGKWDEEAFLGRLTAGRVYESSIMPWENFGLATETDLRSVYRYLRSLPPVHNDVGPTYRKVGWTPPAP
jgi:hypothetical protein